MKTRKPKRILPGVVYLPAGINLREFLWAPDEAELRAAFEPKRRASQLAKLHRLKCKWEREDAERLRRRAAELAVEVEKDKVWLAKEAAWESYVRKAQADIAQMHESDAQVERKLLLARLERATKSINADIARNDRAALTRKGLVRGTR